MATVPILGKSLHEGDYVDWLAEIDNVGGELAWIRKDKDFPPNPTGSSRSPAAINRAVLSSRQVRTAIEAEALRRDCSKDVVKAEAVEILEDMAHKFNMSSVRCVGYAVVKVVKKLFDAVFVNLPALRALRSRLGSDPIIFMPTHKTYLDFILMSLLCFSEDVTLPAIAAGADFQQSVFMGAALRRCGAFYMRRSFGKDKLYWAIFSEYVQTHLIHADRPVEFFLEGTRSRTGKSLHPKYGLLQTVLQPYLRSQVYDIAVVPVTMNYDKILEESLYAYELLGFPKPKETTSGLLRATHILNQSFGNVYVTFAEPISVRQMLEPRISRRLLSFQPESAFIIDSKTRKELLKFGHEIIKIHNENNVVSLWPLASIVIGDLVQLGESSTFAFSQLKSRISDLLRLSNALGFRFHVHTNVDGDLRELLHLHADLFQPFDLAATDFELTPVEMAVQQNATSLVDRHLLQKAVTMIVFANYANKALPFFAEVGILAVCVEYGRNRTVAELRKNFSFLQSIFVREFITIPDNSAEEFKTALARLVNADVVEVVNGEVHVVDVLSLKKLRNFVSPFIRAYNLVYRVLPNLSPRLHATTSKTIIPLLQREIAVVLQTSTAYPLGYYRLSCLSSDIIKNAYHTLTDRHIIVPKPWNALIVDFNKVQALQKDLQKFDQPVQIVVADAEVDIVPRSRL
uniref:PlsC domain-containing protein n=1 Tax=Panagrellus redivivus TaxID=6233 RepID=A0A7E4VIE9_PANRE